MALITLAAAVRQSMSQLIIDAAGAGPGPALIQFSSRSPRTWEAGMSVSLGDHVYAGGKNYDCTTAGVTGTVAPTWPASGTVTDNTVVWTEGGDAGADTLLGELTCSDPCGASVNGVITFGTIAQDNSANATGKARKATPVGSNPWS